MNFTYRGIAYQAPIAGIETHETGQTATFLGKTYKMKQTQITYRQPIAELTYRGICYIR